MCIFRKQYTVIMAYSLETLFLLLWVAERNDLC